MLEGGGEGKWNRKQTLGLCWLGCSHSWSFVQVMFSHLSTPNIRYLGIVGSLQALLLLLNSLQKFLCTHTNLKTQTEEAGNRCCLLQLLQFVSSWSSCVCKTEKERRWPPPPPPSTIKFWIVRKEPCRDAMYQQSEIKPENPAFKGKYFSHSKKLGVQWN